MFVHDGKTYCTVLDKTLSVKRSRFGQMSEEPNLTGRLTVAVSAMGDAVTDATESTDDSVVFDSLDHAFPLHFFVGTWGNLQVARAMMIFFSFWSSRGRRQLLVDTRVAVVGLNRNIVVYQSICCLHLYVTNII